MNQDGGRHEWVERGEAGADRFGAGGAACDNMDMPSWRENVADPALIPGWNDHDDRRKFIAAQHSFDAPKEHGLAAKGKELLGHCSAEPGANACCNYDCPRLFSRKRLLIVHS